jgi:hypothetical protein
LDEHEVQAPNISPLGIGSTDPSSHIDHSIEKQIASCKASIQQARKNKKDQTTRYFSHIGIVKLAHQRSTFNVDARRADFQYKWATYLFVSPPLVHACDLIPS